jgi:hypothetical protein
VDLPLRQIRADFDRDTIVVYQAYNDQIADAALSHGRFTEPFSRSRMTWVKPSFLWMMERSGWGTKANQERTLAVRMSRAGWEEALSLAELTSYTPGVHPDHETWQHRFDQATTRVQWDPERDLRGGKLQHRSIQVGISRIVVDRYVDEWIVSINDYSPLVHKIGKALKGGDRSLAKRLLPPQREYILSSAELAERLGIGRA